MLKNALYIIRHVEQTSNSIKALVELNNAHEIFMGHFPVRAVLPGACMLQMIKEILEETLQSTLRLIKADEIKFLRIIEPETNTAIGFSIEYEQAQEGIFKVNATISKAGAVCYKMKASYKS